MRSSQLPNASEDGTSAAFEITNEDHTLANALRYIIMKKYFPLLAPQTPPLLVPPLTLLSPEVEFCGYSIPHPSEAKVNIRIQTYGAKTAIECLKEGLDDLMDLCDVVTEKFEGARDKFGRK